MLLGDLVYRVGANIEGFNRGMRDVSRQLNKLDRDSARALSGVRNMGRRLSETGRSLTAGFSLPLIAAGAATTKFSIDFNKGMANVASLGEEATERIGEFKEGVRTLAVEVGQRTGPLTDGLYQVVSAFGASGETVQLLGINAKAAAAGLATASEAVALTSAVTKGYGNVSAEAVQKVSDLSFVTVALGQTTFPELAASMGLVVPIANKLNVSQEELFATMATLTGVTGSTSEVATQLRGVLAGMAAPTKAMATAMQSLGYESAEAMIQELGLGGALQALIGTTDGTAGSVKALFGRIEATTGALALAGPQAETYNTKLAAMADAAGATDRAFQAQTEGVNANGFALAQAAAKAEIAGQRFGDALAPALAAALEAAEPLIDAAGQLAEWFANLPEPVQTTIIALGGIAAAVGPVLWGMGTLTQTIVNVHSTVGLFSRGLPKLKEGLATAAAHLPSLKAAFLALKPAIVLAAGAMAGWTIGKWAYSHIPGVKALGDTMADLLLKIPGLEAAWLKLRGAPAVVAVETAKLEEVLKRHGVTIERGTMTEEQYRQALERRQKELLKAQAAQEEATKTGRRATDTEKKLTDQTDDVRAAFEDLGRETGDTTKKLRDFDYEGMMLEQQLLKSEAAIERAREEFEEFNRAWEQGTIADEAELIRLEIDEIERSASSGLPAVNALIEEMTAASIEAAGKVDDLGAHFQTLSMTSETEMQKVVDRQIEARDKILGSDLSTDWEKQTAIYKALQAQVDMAIKMGEDVPRETQEALAAMKAKLEGPGGLDDSVKKPWGDALADVSTNITNTAQSVIGMLIGTEEGSIGGALKKLGQSVLTSFTEPALAAFNKFIREGIEALLAKLTGSGGLFDVFGQLGGLFGIGGGGGGGAPLPGGVPGAGGGGVPGAIGGAVGAGVGGVLGTVFAGVGAAAGVGTFIQGFQLEAGQDAIELNTRISSIHLGFILDKLNQYLPYSQTTNDYIWGPGHTTWNEQLGTLKEHLPHLKTIRDQVVDGIEQQEAARGLLGEIARDVYQLPRIAEENARALYDLARMHWKVNVDVHFDGLVAAVARQVKTNIAADLELQRA